MKETMKRFWATVLVCVLVIGLVPINALAADGPTVIMDTSAITDGTCANPDESDFSAIGVNLITGPLTVDTTFYVPVVLKNMTGINSLNLAFEYNNQVLKYVGYKSCFKHGTGRAAFNFPVTVTSPYNAEYEQAVPLGTWSDNVTGNKVGWMNDTVLTNDENKCLFYAGFTVIGKSATGEETIRVMSANDSAGVNNTTASIAADQITYIAGTVSVEKEASSGGTTTPTNYEIYYTLEKTADGTNAGFKAYDVNEEVKATVYLVNKGEEDINLQAYDIYLDYDSALIYQGTTLQGAIAYKADGEDADDLEDVAKAEDKVIHIQAVGDNNSILETLAVNTPVSLGTITFSIDKDTAVYGTKMPITLTQTGSGKETTNIAVGGETEGDKESHYPKVTQKATVEGEEITFSGAEVNTQYTVSYYDGVNEAAIATQTKQHGKPLTLACTEPTREDYTFAGWQDANGKPYTMGTDYTDNADLNLTAQWTLNTFTVKFFDAKGAEIEDARLTNVQPEATVSFKGENPQKDSTAECSYEFVGWGVGENATKTEDLKTYKITANTDFYPVYKQAARKYTITFDTDGGTAMRPIEVAYGEPIPAITAPEKEGHEFLGWSPALPETMPAEALEVKAQWKVKQYTITFMDGNNVHHTAQVNYGDPIELPENPTPPKGHKFSHWNPSVPGKMPAQDVTVSAYWNSISFTIVFDANGAEGTNPGDVTTYYGGPVTMPGDNGMTKEGYVFAGWAWNKNATTPDYTENQNVSMELDTTDWATETLYAVWQKDVFKISYTHDPEGVSPTTDLPGTYSASAKLEIPAPEAEGYTFLYWTSEKLGITAEQEKKTLSYEAGTLSGEIDLTAHWSVDQYDVTVTATPEGTAYNAFADYQKAPMGQTVTVTVQPNAGYKIEKVEYSYEKTDGTKVTEPIDMSYTGSGNDYSGNFVMPAADVTVTATLKGISYQIHINKNSDDATGTDRYINAVYGELITVTNTYTRPNYDFAYWSSGTTGSGTDTTWSEGSLVSNLTTIENDVVELYTFWNPKSYNVTLNTDSGVINSGNVTEYTYGTGATLPTDVTRDHYTFDGWYDSEGKKVTSISTTDSGDKSYTAKWTAKEYDIVYKDGDKDITTDNPTYTYGKGEALPTVTKPGYTFTGWKDGDGNPVVNVPESASDTQTYYAQFTANEYTITFITNGDPIASKTYTTDTTEKLPVATRENYVFSKWEVTAVDTVNETNWVMNTTHNANDVAPTGFYGDVTLTAQWTQKTSYKVENYLYARSDYRMLRVSAAGVSENEEYQFNGVPMYYTTDADYLVNTNDTGVFYTLIKVDYVGTDGKLTEDGYKLLQKAPLTDGAKRATINYNGDINDDKVVNVADANIVYQMVQQKNGNYYSEIQLEVWQRLAADMHKEAYKDGDYRGNAEDVNAIVNRINTKTTN